MISGSPVVDWPWGNILVMDKKFPAVFSENKPQKTKIKPASHVTKYSQ